MLRSGPVKAGGWSKKKCNRGNGVHSFHCEVCAVDVNMFTSSFSVEVSGSLGPGLVVGGGGASPFSNGVAVMKGVGNIPSGSSPGMVMPRKGCRGRSCVNKRIGKAEELRECVS